MSKMWQSKLLTSVGVLGLTLYAIQSYYDHAGHRDLRPCGLSTRIGRPYTPHSHVYEMLNNTKKNTKSGVLHAKKKPDNIRNSVNIKYSFGASVAQTAL